MKINQEQFDAIVFYSLQSYEYASQRNNKASYESYRVACDRFTAVHYGINILRNES